MPGPTRAARDSVHGVVEWSSILCMTHDPAITPQAQAERDCALEAVQSLSARVLQARAALACPLTSAPPADPAVAADGYTYEVTAVMERLICSALWIPSFDANPDAWC